MSTDHNYSADRTSIDFRPIAYRSRALFPLIFIGAIVYLVDRPGKATHSTVIQACVVFALAGLVTSLILFRSRVTINVTGLVLQRVMSKVLVKWEDVSEIHSGLLAFSARTSTGRRFYVWGVLHWTRWDAFKNSVSAKQVVSWMTQLVDESPQSRAMQIYTGVPNRPT